MLRGRRGGQSLFCSLLSRAAGEFQRVSRESWVNITARQLQRPAPNPADLGRWPDSIAEVPSSICQPYQRGGCHRKGHLKGSANCLALPTRMPLPLPIAVQRQASPCSGTLLASLSVNLIVTQLSSKSLPPSHAYPPSAAPVQSCE